MKVSLEIMNEKSDNVILRFSYLFFYRFLYKNYSNFKKKYQNKT